MATLKQETTNNNRPQSIHAELFKNLRRTTSIISELTEPTLKRKYLTHMEYNVLEILRGTGKDGLSGKEISDQVATKVLDISPALERLEIMEYIRRQRSRYDQRLISVVITSTGLNVLNDLDAPLQEALEHAFEFVNNEEIRILNDYLVKVAKSDLSKLRQNFNELRKKEE